MLRRAVPITLSLLAMAMAMAVSARAAESHEGKVASVSKGKLTVTDKDGKNEHSYTVGSDAKISLDGKPAKLEDLKKGQSVTVTTEEKDKKRVVTKVEAKSAG